MLKKKGLAEMHLEFCHSSSESPCMNIQCFSSLEEEWFNSLNDNAT